MDLGNVQGFLAANTNELDEGLRSLFTEQAPAALYDSVRLVLSSEGKRFRPHLVYCASDMFAGDRNIAARVALAMEVFHIFTLVHDDIMDHSDTRRGKPTIHVTWDEPTAILAGDLLLGKASELLLALPDHHLRTGLGHFAETITVLCEGQVRDMEFESRSDVTLDEYLFMIGQKTSALLQTSLVLGALSGQAKNEDLALLKELGHHLGQAFQIQDDLLDLVSTSASWGKPIGGDLLSGKKAFLLLEALRLEADDKAGYFHRLVSNGGAQPNELEEARVLMEKMGVLETARSSVIFHSEMAHSLLEKCPKSMGQAALVFLTKSMSERSH